MSARKFTEVSFVAEHVPETHRTLENDHTVTEVELPGMVEVYLVIDGGRLPFTHLRGADVLEAIDKAKSKQQTQPSETPGTTAPAEPAAPSTPAETPAPETPQE